MFESINNSGINYWLDRQLEAAGLVHAYFGSGIDLRDRQTGSAAVTEFFGADSLALLKQCHSTLIHPASAAGSVPQGDGWLVEVEPASAGRPLDLFGVLSADCVPVILFLPPAGPDQGGTAAILHCGWRGAVAGLLEQAADRLADAGSGREINSALVSIGPGASVCCFEIGEEIVCEFETACRRINLPADQVLKRREGKLFADIKQLLSAQARFHGISRIGVSPACSICGPGLFSFRREKKDAGRQVSVIGATLRKS